MFTVRFTCESNPPREDSVTVETAVEPEVRLTGLIAAAIVKSGEVEAANVNVAVALCLIPLETPMMVAA